MAFAKDFPDFEEIIRASGNLKRGHTPLVIAQRLHGTVSHYPNQRQLISSTLYLTPPIEGDEVASEL